MSEDSHTRRLLLVTGMSGAGKSTAVRTLEDLGWEVVDNLPLMLLDRLLDAPGPVDNGGEDRPLAIVQPLQLPGQFAMFLIGLDAALGLLFRLIGLTERPVVAFVGE